MRKDAEYRFLMGELRGRDRIRYMLLKLDTFEVLNLDKREMVDLLLTGVRVIGCTLVKNDRVRNAGVRDEETGLINGYHIAVTSGHGLKLYLKDGIQCDSDSLKELGFFRYTVVRDFTVLTYIVNHKGNQIRLFDFKLDPNMRHWSSSAITYKREGYSGNMVCMKQTISYYTSKFLQKEEVSWKLNLKNRVKSNMTMKSKVTMSV